MQNIEKGGMMPRLEKGIAVLLSLIAAVGFLIFFLHHQVVLSAWIGFGSLLFLAFCIWRWGLDSVYLPGLITGMWLASACGYALWLHKNIFVLFCLILVWVLATILWWFRSPISK
jgi:hypothetical protein